MDVTAEIVKVLFTIGIFLFFVASIRGVKVDKYYNKKVDSDENEKTE